jgi:hypothetical protein
MLRLEGESRIWVLSGGGVAVNVDVCFRSLLYILDHSN